MERYVGTKIVLAEPMDKATASFKGLLRDDVIIDIQPDGTSDPGYKVVYEDGYESWSPKAVFERAYRGVTNAELALLTAAGSDLDKPS